MSLIAPSLRARRRSTTVSIVESGGEQGGELQAALAGDRRAWRAIVDEYEGLLWWIARSHRLDENEAGDLVQTVWLALLRHGHSIHDQSRLGGWLSTTAKREAWARVRRSDRERPSEIEERQLDSDSTEVDSRILNDETVGEALRAFRRLGSRCQELLRLTCADPPISYAEIAARLGKSTGYVGPTRARCLAELRTLMTSRTEGGV